MNRIYMMKKVNNKKYEQIKLSSFLLQKVETNMALKFSLQNSVNDTKHDFDKLARKFEIAEEVRHQECARNN